MENSQQLATQLAQYDANRKGSADVLNEAMGKYGVPEIRSRVSGLRTTLTNTENALNAVDPSVTGRTQGSLVTEAQRSKQVANERAPIAEQYGAFSRSLADTQSNLSDQERAAQLLAQGQLNDYEAGRSALSSRYTLALDRENEQRRREEADRAYQLQVQEAQRQAAATRISGWGMGNGNTSPTNKPTAPSIQDQAYGSVQSFLGKGRAAAESDYNATLKSANRGNAMDKLKVQLYNQNGIGTGLKVGVANSGNISVPGTAPKPITLSGSLRY